MHLSPQTRAIMFARFILEKQNIGVHGKGASASRAAKNNMISTSVDRMSSHDNGDLAGLKPVLRSTSGERILIASNHARESQKSKTSLRSTSNPMVYSESDFKLMQRVLMGRNFSNPLDESKSTAQIIDKRITGLEVL
jgi:hypothetical protein